MRGTSFPAAVFQGSGRGSCHSLRVWGWQSIPFLFRRSLNLLRFEDGPSHLHGWGVRTCRCLHPPQKTQYLGHPNVQNHCGPSAFAGVKETKWTRVVGSPWGQGGAGDRADVRDTEEEEAEEGAQHCAPVFPLKYLPSNSDSGNTEEWNGVAAPRPMS